MSLDELIRKRKELDKEIKEARKKNKAKCNNCGGLRQKHNLTSGLCGPCNEKKLNKDKLDDLKQILTNLDLKKVDNINSLYEMVFSNENITLTISSCDYGELELEIV